MNKRNHRGDPLGPVAFITFKIAKIVAIALGIKFGTWIAQVWIRKLFEYLEKRGYISKRLPKSGSSKGLPESGSSKDLPESGSSKGSPGSGSSKGLIRKLRGGEKGPVEGFRHKYFRRYRVERIVNGCMQKEGVYEIINKEILTSVNRVIGREGNHIISLSYFIMSCIIEPLSYKLWKRISVPPIKFMIVEVVTVFVKASFCFACIGTVNIASEYIPAEILEEFGFSEKQKNRANWVFKLIFSIVVMRSQAITNRIEIPSNPFQYHLPIDNTFRSIERLHPSANRIFVSIRGDESAETLIQEYMDTYSREECKAYLEHSKIAKKEHIFITSQEKHPLSSIKMEERDGSTIIEILPKLIEKQSAKLPKKPASRKLASRSNRSKRKKQVKYLSDLKKESRGNDTVAREDYVRTVQHIEPRIRVPIRNENNEDSFI